MRVQYSAEDDIMYLEISLFTEIFDKLYISNYDSEAYTYTLPTLEPAVAKLSAYFINIPGNENISISITTPRSQESLLHGCGWMILKLNEGGNKLVSICEYQPQPNVNIVQNLDAGSYLILVEVLLT